MMAAEDKSKNGPPLEALFDAWGEWKPRWSGRKKPKVTPHDFQERHSPTESVQVRGSGNRQVETSQRRIVDARLWESMSGAQQGAALEIALSYETMGRGMGYVVSNWQRIPGARGQSNVAEAHARLIRGYIEWTTACHKQKISHSMIIDVLVYGIALSKQDRDRRVRKGASRANYLAGLSLYCKMKGWPD